METVMARKRRKQPRRRNLDEAPQSLFERYKKCPNDELRNELVVLYLPLVKYNAERIWSHLPDSVELDDLVSAGVFGLMDAIEAFDLSRGVKFETYCVPRIRGSMLDELRKMDWVPRLVRSRDSQYQQVAKALGNGEGDNYRPTAKEIADYLGVSIEKADYILQNKTTPAPMLIHLSSKTSVSYMGHGAEPYRGPVTYADVIPDKKAHRPEGILQKKEVLSLLLRGLNKHERLLLILYYYEGLTMKQVGAALNLSESRISQMHSDIIRQLAARFSNGQRLTL